jgi:hypothetical protein
MATYLSLFNSYQTIVPAAQANTHDDRVMYQPCAFDPTAPCPRKAEKDACWTEGLAGYWAKLNGLKIKLDYRWKMSVMVEGERGQLVPRYPWNLEQGSKLVDTGDD